MLKPRVVFLLCIFVNFSVSRADILNLISSNFIKNLENVTTPMCQNQLEKMYENLLSGDSNNQWALKMADASSKLPSGLLSLNLGELGNFKQCISSNSLDNDIFGKYCLGFFDISSQTMELSEAVLREILVKKRTAVINNLEAVGNTSRIQGPSWAACLPNGCTTQDVNVIINEFFRLVINSTLTINFPEMFCQTRDDVNKELSIGAIITLAILGVYGLFLIGATIFHVVCDYREKEIPANLLAFSLKRNTEKLFAITIKNRNGSQMPCLDGLRFLSIIWVMAGHQFSINTAGPLANGADLLEWANSMRSMFIVSGTLSVDSFLVVGSVLVVYSFLKMERSIGFKFTSLPIYYLHRYLRLVPPLAAVILISSFLIDYLGSGPRWPSVEPYFQNNCKDYWWSALLFVQNYVNVNKMCVGQTWYLSIDFQLFLITPFLFKALYKWPRPVLCLFLLCTFTSIGLSFYVAWINNLTAILSNIYGNAENYNNLYYLLTHTRAAPWFIGATLGFYIFKIKTGDLILKPNKTKIIAGWLLCLATLFFCVLIGHSTLRTSEFDHWGNSLHIAFIRPFWSLAISWIIFACVIGKGGPINSILSFTYFQVFNRFTYCIYLTHVTMMYLLSFSKKSSEYFSELNMAYNFWGTLAFSSFLSYIFILAFESPIMALEKIILGNKSKSEEKGKNGAI